MPPATLAARDPCRAVFERLPAPEEVDHLAFALLRRHISANLRGDVGKGETTSRLRRINRLCEEGMVGVLRYELEIGGAEEETPAP
jgi:hypothetical protein